MQTGLIIRLDDIAENMNWDLMNKCENLFDNYNIKPLLGVVPNNQDKELLTYEKNTNFWQKVKEWQSKGWEISMHGYSHVYDNETNKKDYFSYGGKSEFFGHSLKEQKKRIREGIKIFNSKGIKIRSFFAPNHTYDLNTFEALKDNKINFVIDGYGLFPFLENEINFIPQLFYKEIMLPYGIQSTQVHLNYWDYNSFDKFSKFIIKNRKNIITFDQACKSLKETIYSKCINRAVEYSLKTIRSLR
tara:strand:+ start:278 stop:1012 length:735 start_codon:yes stop_codon:yes gene_type:complete